jgi:hypothetical protein
VSVMLAFGIEFDNKLKYYSTYTVYDHMVDLESRSKKQVQTAAEVTSFLVDT